METTMNARSGNDRPTDPKDIKGPGTVTVEDDNIKGPGTVSADEDNIKGPGTVSTEG